jgi:response regulator RpfG family c-di-GMP phosphodiesterase
LRDFAKLHVVSLQAYEEIIRSQRAVRSGYKRQGVFLPWRILLYNEGVMPPTILLVEDNPLARRNMMLSFKSQGYDVLQAQRGEEALDLIRDVDNFDVVITDLRMLGMVDGLEVLRVQNEVSPGTKSILLTAYGSNQI